MDSRKHIHGYIGSAAAANRVDYTAVMQVIIMIHIILQMYVCTCFVCMYSLCLVQ